MLRPNLKGKRESLTQLNSQARMELGEKGEFPANPHRLANIGTFRAHIEVYLRTNPRVYQTMTRTLRTLEPTPVGVSI